MTSSFWPEPIPHESMYAHALNCDIREISAKIAELATKRVKPEVVDSAPCKEVVLKGDDIDLTRFPLFLYHPHDGHAYLQDVNVVSRHPDSGLINWGMYRLMYRSRNETNVDMRNDSHNSRVIAKKYQALGQDMPAAMVIGGPTLDKIACMFLVPWGRRLGYSWWVLRKAGQDREV